MKLPIAFAIPRVRGILRDPVSISFSYGYSSSSSFAPARFHPRLPYPRKRLASESFYIFIKQLNSPPGERRRRRRGRGETGANGVKLKRNRTGWQFVLACAWGCPGIPCTRRAEILTSHRSFFHIRTLVFHRYPFHVVLFMHLTCKL